MPGSNITLKQLSSILGVSISTISKALNDSHEISDVTKKRIVEMAKLHNYQPNKIAVGLKSGKTNTIAVVIPSVQNSFFAEPTAGPLKLGFCTRLLLYCLALKLELLLLVLYLGLHQ